MCLIDRLYCALGFNLRLVFYFFCFAVVSCLRVDCLGVVCDLLFVVIIDS